MAIQAREYADDSGDSKSVREFWTSARALVTDEGLLEILRQVQV